MTKKKIENLVNKLKLYLFQLTNDVYVSNIKNTRFFNVVKFIFLHKVNSQKFSLCLWNIDKFNFFEKMSKVILEKVRLSYARLVFLVLRIIIIIIFVCFLINVIFCIFKKFWF